MKERKDSEAAEGSRSRRSPGGGGPSRHRSDLLQLQRSAGNRRVIDAIRSAPAEMTVARWTQLGAEAFYSPPHTADGTGIIAGVPDPADAITESRVEVIYAGDLAGQDGDVPGEVEWRRILGRGNRSDAVRVYGFLRAALLDDSEWQAHVRDNYDGLTGKEQLTRDVGVSPDRVVRTVARPTYDQQRALAKALYLRGRSGIDVDLDEFAGMTPLMTEFINIWQPRILAEVAQDNVPFGSESAEPIGTAATFDQRASMLGSATATMTRAAGEIAGLRAARRSLPPRSEQDAPLEQAMTKKMHEVEVAGQFMRGVVRSNEAIRDSQIALVKNLIAVATAAVPIPGAGKLLGWALGSEEAKKIAAAAVVRALDKTTDVMVGDRLKSGLAAALAIDSMEDRLEDIRTHVAWVAREIGLGDDEDDFVNTVNAAVM